MKIVPPYRLFPVAVIILGLLLSGILFVPSLMGEPANLPLEGYQVPDKEKDKKNAMDRIKKGPGIAREGLVDPGKKEKVGSAIKDKDGIIAKDDNKPLSPDMAAAASAVNNQVFLLGGAFFPTQKLGRGMNTGATFGVSTKTDLPHLLPVSLAGGSRILPMFDAGISFSFIEGKSSENRDDKIAFAPLLFDLYYSIPVKLDRLKIYALLGTGVTLASTVVHSGTDVRKEQSFDFTLRPALAAQYAFTDHFLVRLDVGYFAALEKISGTGIVTTLGFGYVY